MSRPDCSLLVQKSLATGLENGSNDEVHNSIRTKLKRNGQTVIRAPREPAPGGVHPISSAAPPPSLCLDSRPRYLLPLGQAICVSENTIFLTWTKPNFLWVVPFLRTDPNFQVTWGDKKKKPSNDFHLLGGGGCSVTITFASISQQVCQGDSI